ncbi:putative hydro-lyase [Roseibium aggregatum]|uniref:Putative hydro-lyase JF539_13545 n=1 Tax=Roseibium aggregatum TaxID=187304 RepID=A0A939J0R5_9HYPH|nr:putative hydro-lyase [Roseibium aggregatum]MBN9671366.1 putative hydro-lyase [Roseibium aggregatum]
MTSGPVEFSELLKLDTPSQRQAIRAGRYTGHTAGLAKGRLQCNLAILPGEFADDFLEFCRLNPKSCPLAGVSDPGNPVVPRLGRDVDIRFDAARYNIYRNGKLDGQVSDLKDLWRDDLVAFAIGCSFTFENALLEAGIAMRHIDCNVTVPMFRTSIETAKSGPFGGGMVVSMRPIPQERLEEVHGICRKFPLAHGAPVHAGDPGAIGIEDLGRPDWGDPVAVREDEVPVFWACGVTPQVAVMTAKPPLAITHAPGAMLIADVGETTGPIYPYNDNQLKY